MTKTLWCEKERTSNFEIPTYYKVTATKVAEIEATVENEYQDADGNRYLVKRNRFKNRFEFVKIG